MMQIKTRLYHVATNLWPCFDLQFEPLTQL